MKHERNDEQWVNEETISDDLRQFAADIMRHGPTRVLIDEYEGTSPKRARDEHNITPDVVFIRDDGWSLGAPKHLEAAAERMWADKWIGVMRRPSSVPQPYRR